MEFKDHFSTRSALYSQFRPHYPQELFAWLAELAPRHDLALDCGTGNGQAAIGLAAHFKSVVATDASEKQLAMAGERPGIIYRCARAEDSGLEGRSADLVTAAQAIHWFDQAAFYDEARRVLKDDGAVAVWCYGDPVIDDPDAHMIIHNYNRGLIESYWRPERDQILDGLKSLAFPFREVAPPGIILECRWTLAELAGYLRTWSATAAYVEENAVDPVVGVEEELSEYWGPPATRHRVAWPLHIRAGYLT